jgi:hypothetical protein
MSAKKNRLPDHRTVFLAVTCRTKFIFLSEIKKRDQLSEQKWMNQELKNGNFLICFGQQQIKIILPSGYSTRFNFI